MASTGKVMAVNENGNARKMIKYMTSMLFHFTSSSDVTPDFFCISVPILAQIWLVP